MTITEALAEIKTVQARLDKKHQAVQTYLMRDSRLKDPLEREGGSVEFIKRERQALKDLEERKVTLRTAIQRSNLVTTTTVAGVTRTVAEWLTWRREVSAWHGAMLNGLVQGIKQIRDKALRDGRALRTATTGVPEDDKDIVVNLDERELLGELEQHAALLGELDGRLSLLNATTPVEVA